MPKNISVFELREWDDLVEKTYGKPYSFQQQDDCKDRGMFNFTVPSNANDYENDTVPEVVNHSEMGVSFKAWLERDPKQALDGNGNEEEKSENSWSINLWWARNFYPEFQTVANDLCAKGKLAPGNRECIRNKHFSIINYMELFDKNLTLNVKLGLQLLLEEEEEI